MEIELSVNNLEELTELLDKAKSQVQQLKNTLDKIDNFKIQVGQKAKLVERDSINHSKN